MLSPHRRNSSQPAARQPTQPGFGLGHALKGLGRCQPRPSSFRCGRSREALAPTFWRPIAGQEPAGRGGDFSNSRAACAEVTL